MQDFTRKEMGEDCFIPGLPNDLVHSKVLSEISWGDFVAAASVSKLWRATLSKNDPLLTIPPLADLPPDISEKLELGSRSNYGVLLLGRKVVIAGGQSEDSIAMDEVDMFDLDKHRWESLPSLAIPVSTCFMGALASSATPSRNKMVALGGVKSVDDVNSFWIQSAQILGYGDREWAEVEPGDIPKLLESFCCVDSKMNLAMLNLESGGLAKALIS